LGAKRFESEFLGKKLRKLVPNQKANFLRKIQKSSDFDFQTKKVRKSVPGQKA